MMEQKWAEQGLTRLGSIVVCLATLVRPRLLRFFLVPPTLYPPGLIPSIEQLILVAGAD